MAVATIPERKYFVKILNLYAGIGGNRKLWGDNHEVTAVEFEPSIAKIYQDFFPNDKVIVADAHQYLLDHFKEFDFIWASPPCPSHSRLRLYHGGDMYPDMSLYQEIIFLRQWCKGKWLIENVTPYYDPLIAPTQSIQRHLFWSNFEISKIEVAHNGTCKIRSEREHLTELTGFNIDGYSGVDKRKLLRNCVLPEMGLHVFECMKASINE